jgi:TLC domain
MNDSILAVSAATSAQLLSTMSSFWTIYNSDDSFWPLFLPLSLWTATYIYCCLVQPTKDFYRWYAVHNLHNGGAILLGSLSIYYSTATATTTTNFNERIPILWSVSYFLVDTIDCGIRRDWPYLFHAVCCAVLGLANYHTPILRELRMNSKAAFCEVSNPFMHLAKKTRNPLHFGLFAVVFTCCRMLWLPVLYRQLLNAGMEWKDPILLVLAAFYLLNAFWWIKILRILVEGVMGTTTKKEQ